MPKHRVERRSPHPPERLYPLAADVERYPEFVPWIRRMRTWGGRSTSPTTHTFDADATVGFKFFQGSFGSRVLLDDETRTISTSLLSGPFRKLESRWRFDPDGAGSLILFEIDFEFRSHLLQILLDANFDYAVGRLIGCFEARADAVYASPTSGT